VSYDQRIKQISDRTRDSADHYPTPLPFCRAALELLPSDQAYEHILDPGAGTGPWGQIARAMWPKSLITGIEIREDVVRHSAYTTWHRGSFFFLRTPKEPKGPFRNERSERRILDQYRFNLWASQQPVWESYGTRYDLIIGNPPFGLAEEFVRYSLSLLDKNGWLVFLLRLAFLEGQDRGRGLWSEFPLHTCGVYSPRPSFTGDGKTDATAYAAYVWQKGFAGETRLTHLMRDCRPVPSTVCSSQPTLWDLEVAA
jgi:hypothetical protein